MSRADAGNDQGLLTGPGLVIVPAVVAGAAMLVAVLFVAPGFAVRRLVFGSAVFRAALLLYHHGLRFVLGGDDGTGRTANGTADDGTVLYRRRSGRWRHPPRR